MRPCNKQLKTRSCCFYFQKFSIQLLQGTPCLPSDPAVEYVKVCIKGSAACHVPSDRPSTWNRAETKYTPGFLSPSSLDIFFVVLGNVLHVQRYPDIQALLLFVYFLCQASTLPPRPLQPTESWPEAKWCPSFGTHKLAFFRIFQFLPYPACVGDR